MMAQVNTNCRKDGSIALILHILPAGRQLWDGETCSSLATCKLTLKASSKDARNQTKRKHEGNNVNPQHILR